MDDHTMQAAALKEFRELCYNMIDCSKPIVSLLCGMARAKYYIPTCEPFLVEEAERIGGVPLCVPDEDLARGPQRPIRWSKHALNDWLPPAGPFAQ